MWSTLLVCALAGAAPPPPVTPAPVASPPPGPVDPLRGATHRDRCHDDVLLLLEHDFAVVQGPGGPRSQCCRDFPDTLADRCGLDWPFNDVPTCDAWAWWRNAIFAHYGYPFADARWVREFTGKPYYTRREDFDASWLSPAASRNVALLLRYEREGHLCQRPDGTVGPAR